MEEQTGGVDKTTDIESNNIKETDELEEKETEKKPEALNVVVDKEEAVVSVIPSSPIISVSTPSKKLPDDIVKKDESFDMPWEFSSSTSISLDLTDDDDDDDDSSLVRLITIFYSKFRLIFRQILFFITIP